MVDLELKLPDGFLDEEIRCGYAVSHEMKKIWAVELDLLYVFDRVCAKHNIRYWADGGTMLGAVRHQGFIPWDDDIDIVMMREDYARLCCVAEKEFTGPYFFQTEYTDPGSLSGHAQLRNSATTGILKSKLKYKYRFNQGIFIDIFPLDFLPDDKAEQDMFIQTAQNKILKAKKYEICRTRYIENRYNPGKKLLNLSVINIMHMLNYRNKDPNKYFVEFENYVWNSDQKHTGTIGKLFFYPVKEKSIWKKEWFQSFQLLPFEMLSIPVSTEYDAIMTRFFGDWRVPHQNPSYHDGVLFDTEHPYTYYL